MLFGVHVLTNLITLLFISFQDLSYLFFVWISMTF